MTGAREYLKLIIAVPLVLIFNLGTLLIPMERDLDVSSLLHYKIFASTTQSDVTMFVLTIGNLYFLFVFNLLFGTYLFKDINENGIALFSRVRNRQKWWRAKAAGLILFAFLYTFIVITLLIIISGRESTAGIDGAAVLAAIRLVYLFTALSALSTLLINVAALKWGSVTSFLCVYFIEAVLILSEILPGDHLGLRVWHWINPFGGVFSIYEMTGKVIFQFIYLAALLVLLMYASGRYVAKSDIGLEDVEVM
ncbi:MAG: hypothetical protein LBL36_04195 [Clostridiales Family XIII bacterium]|jgi:hypothetical protein|nr:hypothetical protein [Clostridiales Family XIII bacterium]